MGPGVGAGLAIFRACSGACSGFPSLVCSQQRSALASCRVERCAPFDIVMQEKILHSADKGTNVVLYTEVVQWISGSPDKKR